MQLSYHYSLLLLRALQGLAEAAPTGAIPKAYLQELRAASTAPPMPSNVVCSPEYCKFDLHCAYEAVPQYQGPKIEAWRVYQGEAKKGTWPVMPGEDQPPWQTDMSVCDGDGAQSEPCFRAKQHASFADNKRGHRRTIQNALDPCLLATLKRSSAGRPQGVSKGWLALASNTTCLDDAVPGLDRRDEGRLEP